VTVLVGVVHNGRTWVGADSATTNGDVVAASTQPKVWQQGDFVFACTGALREQQIIQHRVTLPNMNDSTDVLRYLCIDFADALRQARKDSGFDEKVTTGQELGPVLLIGYEDRLFTMDSYYAVEEFADFAARGCGRELAMGSLHTTAGIWRDPRKRITAALEAACSVNAYCKPPFTIVCTP
jgi:ATP-dependent protease HslVU (ClpYQ) peptidase subunit